jgi:hypothetical protein
MRKAVDENVGFVQLTFTNYTMNADLLRTISARSTLHHILTRLTTKSLAVETTCAITKHPCLEDGVPHDPAR